MDVVNQVLRSRYALYHGDSVDVMNALPEDSVGLIATSPPFESLYTYSAQARDAGNSRDSEEFFEHFGFFVDGMTRVIKPGRMAAIHCMPLPTSKARDGYIGARDFPGDVIRIFQSRGWVYHCEICIWKDPVTAMQRTKAHGLLHKTLKADSARSRVGYPDKVIVMRSAGENAEPIQHDDWPLDGPEGWQAVASPVWMDIDPGDTLQHRSARDADDERHICPLQLPVIRRMVRLWSNEGDVVLSPFAGIGSEGVVALELGRKFVGAELKESYYRQAKENLRLAGGQLGLFEAED